MTTDLVATLARYVLVEAANKDAARELGMLKLCELYADLRAKLRRDVPINICTVRPATDDEIALQRFHDEMVAREQELRRAKD
ncbi:MAG: hypothetical protein IT424_11405 [Pirellulales bacterium]|nr:hypothetical protein [Pirellulales bacterium]